MGAGPPHGSQPFAAIGKGSGMLLGTHVGIEAVSFRLAIAGVQYRSQPCDGAFYQ